MLKVNYIMLPLKAACYSVHPKLEPRCAQKHKPTSESCHSTIIKVRLNATCSRCTAPFISCFQMIYEVHANTGSVRTLPRTASSNLHLRAGYKRNMKGNRNLAVAGSGLVALIRCSSWLCHWQSCC
jgi:hypothetical protein